MYAPFPRFVALCCRWLILVGLQVGTAGPLGGQEAGSVTGTVTQQGTGVPVPGISVAPADAPRTVLTSQAGGFTIRGLPPGPQILIFSGLGYATREMSVTVAAGVTAELDVELEQVPVQLSDLLVTAASRVPERVVEAPAAISVVRPSLANDLSITAQAPRALANLPGVEVVQSGTFDFNVNTRGFNSSLTRRMLVLQDGRDLSLALLGFQEWSALTNPIGDFRSIEVVRGPGSALYGANAYSGVIDLRTWSPREVSGGKLQLAGGELGTTRGDARYAATSRSGRVGYKVNGGFSRGDSWTRSRTSFDGADLRREYAEATDEDVGDARDRVPLFGQTMDSDTGTALGDPDPVTSIYGSGRFDFYAAGGSVGTVEGGAARVENTTWVTGIGRIQIDEVFRPWARVGWAAETWNVSGWYSGRNTGDTPQRSLSSGAPITDKSSIAQVETQLNRWIMDERIRTVVGASARSTATDTEGTLFPSKDDDRRDGYYSVYSQADVEVTSRIQLVAAVRWDDGDLFDAQWSPRVSLVYSPNRTHSIRLTAGRAFQTPTQVERFVRVPAAAPADFTALENGLRASALGTVLADVPEGELFTNSSSVPVLALGNRDLGVETVRSFEVGYKGDVGQGIFVTIDTYYSDLTNFVTDLTPGANSTYGPWTAPPSVPEGSRAVVEETVRSQLLTAGQSLAALGLTRLADESTAIVVSYGNAGKATEYGVELGLSAPMTRQTRLDASYTYFGFDVDRSTTLPGDDLKPNTARHRGSVSMSYAGRGGLDVAADGRFVEAFDWSAGVFKGRIPSSQTFDLRVGYRLGDHVRVHSVASNVFDQKRFHLYGGSVIGRRIVAGATLAF